MAKVLIIDDDSQICKMLVKAVEKDGIKAVYSLTLKEGIDTLNSDEFDVVLLDINLPDGDGLAAIETIKENPFDPEIIIMTGYGDPEGVELAMKSGAWDYIQKGESHNEFKFSLSRALKYRQQKLPNPQKKSFAQCLHCRPE